MRISGQEQKFVKSFCVIFGIMAISALILWILPINNKTFDLIMGQICILGSLLMICIGKIHDILADSKRITIPLAVASTATGFLLHLFTKWYQSWAFRWGMEVSPGKSQVSFTDFSTGGIDLILVGAAAILLAPILEELLFRFIGLGIVYNLLTRMARERYAKLALIPWVFCVTSLFAILHGPNKISFPAYFVPGMVYSLIYLRYGLFASILTHSSSNAAALLWLIAP